MLQVQALNFNYYDRPLFKNIQFTLEKGKILHLRGANGAGKTTMLRLLAGILHPASGAIYYQNQNIMDNLPLYQQQICYVGHKSGLEPLLTVAENCYADSHWSRKKNDISVLLKRFDLERLIDKPCYQLSAGQLRRVALLRLLMTNATLWLLDEPWTALDDSSAAMLTVCLKTHQNLGGQIILTSHQTLPAGLAGSQEYVLS